MWHRFWWCLAALLPALHANLSANSSPTSNRSTCILCLWDISIPPVFSMRWSFFQPQQSITGSAEWQTTDPISPLLLCPDTQPHPENIRTYRYIYLFTNSIHCTLFCSPENKINMFTHQSVHAQSCGGSTSPWQHTLDTQCTCRSSRQSPWQRLRSTKRIWTWAPGRKSSPERTSSWTDEQSRADVKGGGGARERVSEWVFGSTSGSMRSEASSWVSSGGSEGHRPGSQTGNT